MKSRLVAVAVCVAILIMGCSKQYSGPDTIMPNDPEALGKQHDKIIVSKWEPINKWSTTENANYFSFSKTINKNSEGAVLVFARNLWLDDPAYQELNEADEPLMMPFHFLPFDRKPFYTEQWNYKASGEQLNVDLKISGNREIAAINKKVELQYIIIPQQILKQTGHTEQSLHHMSYNELIQKFKLSS